MHSFADATYRNIVFTVAFLLLCAVIVDIFVAVGSKNAAVNAAEEAKNAAESTEAAQEQDNANAEAAREQILDLISEIESCTTPDGKCAKRQAAQSAEIVGQINAISLAATWCNDQPNVVTYQDHLACAERLVGTSPFGGGR